ncbi:DUF29 domain-containing protein [Jiella endophytica]|uniref:DUF29 domain-containing protein n=2 Tax=Jiella endophytica TaxID=2558362 RepID=A0A4Y8RC70_9HYPH|nr:DUF29 domain-containing protein [Jiella endophytica]
MARPGKPDDAAAGAADYDRDFYAWTQSQAERLRSGHANAIDWERLAEEIENLGGSEIGEIENRLNVLILHLLKWRHQPSHRSSGWKGTILEQRRRIAKRMIRSPSLKALPGQILQEEYASARLKAAGETGLAEEAFPADCPFSVEQILDEAFYPEA